MKNIFTLIITVVLLQSCTSSPEREVNKWANSTLSNPESFEILKLEELSWKDAHHPEFESIVGAYYKASSGLDIKCLPYDNSDAKEVSPTIGDYIYRHQEEVLECLENDILSESFLDAAFQDTQLQLRYSAIEIIKEELNKIISKKDYKKNLMYQLTYKVKNESGELIENKVNFKISKGKFEISK